MHPHPAVPVARLAFAVLVAFVAVVATWVGPLGPTEALAQPVTATATPVVDPSAHSAGMRRLEAGVAAASAQRYAEAAVAFEEAYALLGTAELSYNVAVMRERAGDLGGALRAYDRFLAAAPPTSIAPGLRPHVEDLRARTGTTGPTPNAVSVTPHAQPTDTPIVSDLPESDYAGRDRRPPPGPTPGGAVARASRGVPLGPVVLLGAGGASLLAAGVFAGLRSSALSACDVSPNGSVARCPTTEARDTASAAPTWALGANIAVGVGIAALATGALWWALTPSHAERGGDSNTRNARDTIAPSGPPVSVAAGPSGLVVAGRF